MIAWLTGKICQKSDASAIVDVQGVGYEVFCSSRTIQSLGEISSPISFQVHTHYKSDGAVLFGFLNCAEKELFLNLIKVDSVGPKSALNILSAGPWQEIVELIEDGDVATLSKLPKISKKTAEHVIVKLKGKLSELLLMHENEGGMTSGSVKKSPKVAATQQMRIKAHTALVHLGYRGFEVEKALDELDSQVWMADLESIIRSALNDLSGNN